MLIGAPFILPWTPYLPTPPSRSPTLSPYLLLPSTSPPLLLPHLIPPQLLNHLLISPSLSPPPLCLIPSPLPIPPPHLQPLTLSLPPQSSLINSGPPTITNYLELPRTTSNCHFCLESNHLPRPTTKDLKSPASCRRPSPSTSKWSVSESTPPPSLPPHNPTSPISLHNNNIQTNTGLGKYGAAYRPKRRNSPRGSNLQNLIPIHRSTVPTSKSDPSPTLILCNARSINNKSASLRDFFMETGADLACITETWVREGEKASLKEISPPHFSAHHQFRSKGRGGGVAILIRDTIPYQPLPESRIPDIECVGLSCGQCDKTAIWLVYRPPNTSKDSDQKLLELISTWILTYPKLLVLGDFNVHAESSSEASTDLISTVISLGLTQHVTGPTHEAGHTLDVILSSGIGINPVTKIWTPWSDHCTLKTTLDMTTQAPSTSKILIRPRKQMDPGNFKAALRPSVRPVNSLNELVENWNTNLSEAIDAIAPRKAIVPRRKTSPWYTEELRERKRELRRLERTWRKYRTEASRISYKTLCRSYEAATKRAKQEFLAASIAAAKSQSSQLFKVVQSFSVLTNDQSCFPRTLIDSETFKEYFIHKVSSLRDTPPTATTITIPSHTHPDSPDHTPPVSSTNHLIQFTQIETEDTAKFLTAMKPTTCSSDPCPSHLVKACAGSLLTHLTDIINLSFTSGTFPPSLKEAVVKPLLKNASLDPLSLTNYRPVSNLSFLGKILEKVATSQLQNYLSKTHFLDTHQSGFRPGHGTETVLLALTDDLRRQIDRSRPALLILLDLSAAFDLVDFDILSLRLESAGVHGLALQWLNSFLRGRTMRVEIGTDISSPAPLECGVPQGAILSPLLFNVYVQPLAKLVRSFGLGCHQYADDTQLYLLLDDLPSYVPDQLMTCLTAVTNWLKQNRLKLNPSKTEILWLGHGDPPNWCPTLDGVQLHWSSSVKSLGVILDPALTMSAQVSKAARSAFFHLRQARQLAPYLSTPDLAKVIHATVTSRLDYCNSLYAGLTAQLTRKLQLVQNAAARLLTRTPWRQHITPVLRELHWLPVEYRVQFKILTLTFKALNDLGPSYLKTRLFQYNPPRPLRSTHSNKLVVPGPKEVRLNSTKLKAFSSVAPALWNSLPVETRSLRDLAKFRKACKTELFRKAFT